MCDAPERDCDEACGADCDDDRQYVDPAFHLEPIPVPPPINSSDGD
jgi:hypothetical protein